MTMRQTHFFLSLLFAILWCVRALASDKEDEHKPKEGEHKPKEDEHKSLKIGNLALRSSQQPGPLLGFGENIIDKNQVQLFLFGDDYIGKGARKYFIDIIPAILYGITDNFSVFFNVPVAKYRDRKHRSSGFEDIFVQFEYAFYNKQEKLYADQATIVTNIAFPTGSSLKVPPTGFGTVSIFLGLTYNRTAIDWFYFTSYGATVCGEKNRTKIGNEYLYQCGFGRNIFNLPGWIFAWMVEVNGIYAERNKIRGVIDRNSGGNAIYVTPSLWISSKQLVLQLGAGYAVYQHLFGHQVRDQYLVTFNLGWTW